MPLTGSELFAIGVRLFTALIGTLGFSLMFCISRKRVIWACLGGLLTYAVYELTLLLGGGTLTAAFSSSLFMSLYSESVARLVRAPAVIFLFPCAIPIVPGGALYRTIYNLLFYNQESFLSNAEFTLSTALGIAVGMSVASIVIALVLKISSCSAVMRDNKSAD